MVEAPSAADRSAQALPQALPARVDGSEFGQDLWVADPDYSAKFAHWNGKSWKLYPMPSGVSDLSGIAVVSSDDAWACGMDEDDRTGHLGHCGNRWSRGMDDPALERVGLEKVLTS